MSRKNYNGIMDHLDSKGFYQVFRPDYSSVEASAISCFTPDLSPEDHAVYSNYKNLMSGFKGKKPSLEEYMIAAFGAPLVQAFECDSFDVNGPSDAALKAMLSDFKTAIVYNIVKELGGIDFVKSLKSKAVDEAVSSIDLPSDYKTEDEYLMDFSLYFRAEDLEHFKKFGGK